MSRRVNGHPHNVKTNHRQRLLKMFACIINAKSLLFHEKSVYILCVCVFNDCINIPKSGWYPFLFCNGYKSSMIWVFLFLLHLIYIAQCLMMSRTAFWPYFDMQDQDVNWTKCKDRGEIFSPQYSQDLRGKFWSFVCIVPNKVISF